MEEASSMKISTGEESRESPPDLEQSHATTFLSPELESRIRLKTDLVVLPLIVLISTLAFLDKNGMAYAAVYGMKTDTHLVGQQYSWLGSIFYFGYLTMEFPTAWILTKVPLGKFLGVFVFIWGGVLCCMAACHNFAGLATVRFFLGIFEAPILPALMIMNSMWYRRKEQPLRTALWYNTFAGIFGGILSYAIGHIGGGLATWKYIFIIYGSVTMGVGIGVFFLLPDSPSTAWFFTPEEREGAILRLAENQTGKWESYQVMEALKDPKYWCVAIFVIAQSITNAGVTNFNPLIISGYGFSQTKTTLMATPQAAVALVAQVACTVLVFLIPNIRCLLWVLSTLPALVGAIMIHVLNISVHRGASLAGVYLMGFYNTSWVLMLSLQSSNTGGMTKKSFVSVSIAIFYAVGNIVGPQFFINSEAPYYHTGISTMLGCFAIMGATGIAYAVIVLALNKKRDREYGVPLEDAVVIGLESEEKNLTDMQNVKFRYVY
ncbi:hypothetical protein BP5796_04305 [Coleophoma crateriformis]|uniref:Major facilitator superfamily (MFS) profile domain-containing protein n=1 Tax=Coleophoma crateriformis TaxID=565419 RepID=A0A3D8SI34_9HELO|nr:hypothetical protein BP5796_04305 [Coleophoma crateriformis]